MMYKKLCSSFLVKENNVNLFDYLHNSSIIKITDCSHYGGAGKQQRRSQMYI